MLVSGLLYQYKIGLFSSAITNLKGQDKKGKPQRPLAILFSYPHQINHWGLTEACILSVFPCISSGPHPILSSPHPSHQAGEVPTAPLLWHTAVHTYPCLTYPHSSAQPAPHPIHTHAVTFFQLTQAAVNAPNKVTHPSSPFLLCLISYNGGLTHKDEKIKAPHVVAIRYSLT